MKILIAHKFYLRNGGDSIYSINLENLLKRKGHEVAFFAMNSPQNIKNNYSRYWSSFISYNSPNKKDLIKLIMRPFGTTEVRNYFKSLLFYFKPDIVHLNTIHSQLSPVLAEIAKQEKIPVVWTMHDYKSICPSYTLFRNGNICEDCFKNDLSVILNRCLKNSFLASTLAFFESKKWTISKIESCTDTILSPSKFLKQKYIQAGFSEEKIVQIYNYVDFKTITNNPSKEKYYCYFGRLSYEKGLVTLLETAKDIKDKKLKIIGTGPLYRTFKEKYTKYSHIQFLGHSSWENLKEIVSKAHFCVVPSEWYENNPLTIIESLALGTRVLGADIGGISELLDKKINGMLFQPKNRKDLQDKIHKMFCFEYSEKSLYKIQKSAFENYNEETHYTKLMNIYQNLIK